MYGENSFQASTLRLWNELPNNIKLAVNKEIFVKKFKPIFFLIGVFIILNQFIMYEIYLIYMSSGYVLVVF